MALKSCSLLEFILLSLLCGQVVSQYSITLQNQTRLCAQYENFNTSNHLYTVSTNEWGADGSGGQCITVGNNEDTTDNATAFSSTWGWSDNASLVHAYPNVKLQSHLLPLALHNLSSMTVDVSWSYEGGSSASGENDFDAVGILGTKANVAVDMFLDSDPENSTSTTKPEYEIMVWLGRFGGAQPIGYSNGTRAKKTVSSKEFDLYVGSNDNGQMVFSWLGPSNLTSFSGDISPLVRHVAFYGGPKASDYLGVFQFGTETIHTVNGYNVTFTAKSVLMDVVKGIAPVDSAAVGVRADTVLFVSIICFATFVMSQ